jgi:phosphonatase-like hydrolase
MKTKMIVFDMAGTSVDEGNVVYKTLHKAIEKNFPEISFDQVLLWGAGKEKLQAIKDTLTNTNHSLSEETTQEIFAVFLQELEIAYQSLVVIPTKNTERLFLELRTMNIKVVLNTGYNFATARSLIHKLNWIEGLHYDLLVTASDVSKNRPHPDMILFAMKALDINDPQTVIKVGDSTIDIEEGRNAGCLLNIGVTTGAHTKEELQKANPDYIFDNIYDIKNILI